MTYPTVNLNGTSAEELFRQLADAGDAVHRAIGALIDAQPHGRDYPLGDHIAARAEHRARLAKLEDVLTDLQALAQNISDQRSR